MIHRTPLRSNACRQVEDRTTASGPEVYETSSFPTSDPLMLLLRARLLSFLTAILLAPAPLHAQAVTSSALVDELRDPGSTDTAGAIVQLLSAPAHPRTSTLPRRQAVQPPRTSDRWSYALVGAVTGGVLAAAYSVAILHADDGAFVDPAALAVTVWTGGGAVVGGLGGLIVGWIVE